MTTNTDYYQIIFVGHKKDFGLQFKMKDRSQELTI